WSRTHPDEHESQPEVPLSTLAQLPVRESPPAYRELVAPRRPALQLPIDYSCHPASQASSHWTRRPPSDACQQLIYSILNRSWPAIRWSPSKSTIARAKYSPWASPISPASATSVPKCPGRRPRLAKE